ncbi:MAG: hypothetical protein ACYCW6_17095 [Candidatus Xenobia bacterium]
MLGLLRVLLLALIFLSDADGLDMDVDEDCHDQYEAVWATQVLQAPSSGDLLSVLQHDGCRVQPASLLQPRFVPVARRITLRRFRQMDRYPTRLVPWRALLPTRAPPAT